MSQLTKPERIQLWLERFNRHAVSQLTVAQFFKLAQISQQSFY